MPPAASFGPTHTFLRGLAAYAFASFWHRVLVLASAAATADEDSRAGRDAPEERVPREGTPCIVVANHWNSAADVAVLSCYFPHYRKLHYWAKSTLFAPGLPRKILLDAGNIPVDRKNKDNQKLFAASFDALKAGEAIVVFPEGGSETVHELPPLKDGASWAALEYAKNIRDPATRNVFADGTRCESEPRDVVICVAGIAYSDKTKYRGCATLEFGPNIDVAPYVDEFLNDPKTAVKRLTAHIYDQLVQVTVNAPDWESRHAAMMARKILWPDDRKLPLENLREIDQTLVDLFASPAPSRSLRRLVRLLNTYRDALYSTGLSHLSLSSLPLPSTLDPAIPHPLPTRVRVLASILWSTTSCLVRLPFFLLPLVVHLPVYLFARYASSGALEEDQAQNKVAIGLVLALATYAAFFGVACALLWTSIAWGGAIVVALAGTVAFVAYHNRLVDANYREFQRLSALWTVLFALWTPVARSEAEHFLHAVHPSLSPHPGIRLRHSSDTPYETAGETDGEDGEGRGLLALQTDDDDDGEDDEDAEAEGEDGDARRVRHRSGQPSPALFSEQDRLLGGPARSPASPRTPQLADTTIEMPHLLSAAEQRPARRAPRTEHTVRELLRLRAQTVLALRALLFPPPVDMEDVAAPGMELTEVQVESAQPSRGVARRRSISSASSSAGTGATPPHPPPAPPPLPLPQEQHQPLSEREAASSARAREVGRRMRELGWRGEGVGPLGAGGSGERGR